MSKNAITVRRRDLAHAVDYTTWKDIALELDQLEGGAAWREDETSDAYDHLLIRERLEQLRQLRAAGEIRPLIFDLVAGLHGNLGNIANPRLYVRCRVGTKQLVTDYIEEVVRCLDFVCQTEFSDFSDADKIVFFKRAGHSFGRSALLLSGGATLGMFHIGVVKALWERGLLPRVLTGSSAGSIIASMAASRDNAEMPSMFDTRQIDLNAFRKLDLHGMFQSGALLDQNQLEHCICNNIAQRDFIGAFEHSRRILGITVSPAETNQHMRLLNYLTAPHVLVHRAVLASCAVPGVFPPVMLKALDYAGNEVPYMHSSRWVDGSLASDLPLLRLARMHNINHYIVSQTNPHIVPLMRRSPPRTARGMMPYARDMALALSRDTVGVTRRHLGTHGALGTAHIIDRVNQVLQQRYAGDITIYPRQTTAKLARIFANLSPDQLQKMIREGEHTTWPQIERIRLQTRISRAFEDSLERLKERGAFGNTEPPPPNLAPERKRRRLVLRQNAPKAAATAP